MMTNSSLVSPALRVSERELSLPDVSYFDADLRPSEGPLSIPASDFSVSAWVRLDEAARGGGIFSQYDEMGRTGFHLGVQSLDAACTSVAMNRHLVFGMDAGTEPVWRDCGRAGNAMFPYAFSVYQGAMFAGTCTAEPGDVGKVMRHLGGDNWQDCGCPCRSNAITALAEFRGRLYAASSSYNFAATRLEAAGNDLRDGHVYVFDGVSWEDCGKVSDCPMIGGFCVLDGRLYASVYEMQFNEPISREHCGLYRLEEPGRWVFCGHPGGRVVPLTTRAGKIIAGSFDGGQIYAYDPSTGTWEDWGKPPGEKITQIYSFVDYQGRLLAGAWQPAKVFAIEGPGQFVDLGTLGAELEVMGMAVYNGKLYAGTLPLAEIYRYDGETTWTLIRRLDHSPVEFRRAWSLGQFGGKLYSGVVPAGKIFEMSAGAMAQDASAFPSGWQHITAVRSGAQLSLYRNGTLCARETMTDPGVMGDLGAALPDLPLEVGRGPSGPWPGEIHAARIYGCALREEDVRNQYLNSAQPA